MTNAEYVGPIYFERELDVAKNTARRLMEESGRCEVFRGRRRMRLEYAVEVVAAQKGAWVDGRVDSN